ncbi:proprotein convertase subtilisin/kexin type 5-like [Eleginops maclovinus]|uniref:proprotein convertase subtilisin/kexin type 5-like n=1 Tax=Eleginops maclovinus TaxID=56733 RepID=UPI0030807A2D
MVFFFSSIHNFYSTTTFFTFVVPLDKFQVARYLFYNQCRDVCPEGFFHSKWKRCEACPAECIICSSTEHCLQCSPGHQLRNNKCVPLECNAGQVADADAEDCVPCNMGCKQCERKDSRDEVCLKCEDDFYQLGSDCHQSCPDRTYNGKDTMVCAPCEDKQCLICDQSQCYWCEEGFYLSDDECVDHCKEGFFVDEKSQECEPCHHACRTCGGPQYDDCDSCEEELTLKNGECVENQNLASCPETQFRNSHHECELCHSTCKTCSAATNEDCNSCYLGSFLTPHQTCVSRCPAGTFSNKASSQCEDCLTGCVTCQDAKQCQRCSRGLFLQNGVCVADCQRGFPQGAVCQPCATECASCRGNSSHCLSCEEQFLLLEHSCMSHCLEGYYATETECHRCPAQCTECSQDGLCKKCAQYYFLHEDKCVDDCPNGFFASEKSQECISCHADCASCDGPDFDDCDVCSNTKAVRHNGECRVNCPDNTYYDATTNECRDCDRSCLTCSGHEPSSCLSCQTNMQKDASGHCVGFMECALDSYMNHNRECQKCHKVCHRCSGPDKDHCLSCNKPHFLLNKTCVQECPVGLYAEDRDERVCERCHFSCKSCMGRHSLQCVDCRSGFFKQGSNCVETCSESHFGNTTTMACERCDPSCTKCWGRGNTNCLSCRDRYVYLRQSGQCLKSCPPSFYQHSRSKTCQKCHPTCKTCSDEGALACQSCYEGYTFMGGICSSQCLLGFFVAPQGSKSTSNEPNCQACHPSCLDCRGPGMWSCTVCPALQILADDGRCMSCCGNETHNDDKLIPWECCDCKASQVECIKGVNFVLRDAKELQAQGSTAKHFVTVCVFIILSVGGGVFLYLNAQSKTLAIVPKTKAGGYEKLDTQVGIASQPTTSSYGEYNDRIVGCEDDEEDNHDDEDIVYMGKDGTVYRKFKYGFLDEDEIELEYDDESYQYK